MPASNSRRKQRRRTLEELLNSVQALEKQLAKLGVHVGEEASHMGTRTY